MKTTSRTVVKTNSFVRVLEEVTAWQFASEINWPLVKTISFVRVLEEFTAWQFAFEMNWPLIAPLLNTPLTHVYLQETKLDLLTPDECSYFEKMLAPNRTNEICTGRKNSFPKHWKFKRLLSKTKKKYHFKLIGPSTNYLGFKKTKYNFYLGGTDSCQGT